MFKIIEKNKKGIIVFLCIKMDEMCKLKLTSNEWYNF